MRRILWIPIGLFLVTALASTDARAEEPWEAEVEAARKVFKRPGS